MHACCFVSRRRTLFDPRRYYILLTIRAQLTSHPAIRLMTETVDYYAEGAAPTRLTDAFTTTNIILLHAKGPSLNKESETPLSLFIVRGCSACVSLSQKGLGPTEALFA